MKLSSRLTILLVCITALVALLVGWYAVATSTRADYSALDSTISAVVDSGEGHPLTALSSALNVVQENSYDLTLDVVGSADSVTQIEAGDVPLVKKPTLTDVLLSLSAVRSSADLPGFRYRSVSVGAGDYLVVAAATNVVASESHNLIVRTLIVGVLAAAVMAVAAELFMRREMRTVERLIAYATAVAHGDVDRSVPPAEGSTDIRELQASLSRMVESLRETIETEQRVAKVTQQFIGDASHELRTPLTVVKGYTELLSNPDVDDSQRGRALERIRKEVTRMDGLVSDLLLLAEVNEIPDIEGVPVDLSELVTSSANDFVADYPERPIESFVDPQLVIVGRRDYLERMILNALTNIARHTGDHDPVRINVGAGNGRVTLVIEDGGPGLPPATYGQPLERFHRFDESRSRSSGGSGLGMSIMGDIATAMGGTMSTSRSTLGGLALTFDFPRAEATSRGR